jgi:hypothetical protein
LDVGQGGIAHVDARSFGFLGRLWINEHKQEINEMKEFITYYRFIERSLKID